MSEQVRSTIRAFGASLMCSGTAFLAALFVSPGHEDGRTFLAGFVIWIGARLTFPTTHPTHPTHDQPEES